MRTIRFFSEISIGDVKSVGGKNASLGEMLGALGKKGIRVPDGFATTAEAYFEFLKANKLDKTIAALIDQKGAGAKIRKAILAASFPPSFETEILAAYKKLGKNIDVAVRSSATAEDLPEASFAGQQDTYLHIQGEKALLDACKKCFASLFTDRAIAYRNEKGFGHLDIALSIGIERMVRSDKGGSGVMFTIDTESGFPDCVVINATFGLGELIVQGEITPDEYRVFKPHLHNPKLMPLLEYRVGPKRKKMVYVPGGKTKVIKAPIQEQRRAVLTEKEVIQLARWAQVIEDHYQKPMDIEWAKDGITKELFIVQARPETVQSQQTLGFKTYHLKERTKKLATGLSVGSAIAIGKVCKLDSPKEMGKFPKGAILVTKMTDPDWVPIMRQASAIVTDHGGRTSHAAIVSRELGVPAIVGTDNGTKILSEGKTVTVSCAEGDHGFIYEGECPYSVKEVNLEKLPQIPVDLMLNIADPASAMLYWKLPTKGIGLARMEFIVSNEIQIHPMALVHYPKVKDRAKIEKLTYGYKNKEDYFIEKLSYGIAKIAASQYPHPTILRLSDFKTNEYAQLIGGKEFEPKEENPMIGWRGASRYYHPNYEAGFALECKAIQRARDLLGMQNIKVMVPFCRTPEEADQVLATMAKYGLKRGENHLELYVMCEIPSNIILTEEFAMRFDGFSIGSNDLTQLLLGVDRDSALVAPIFNEENPAVTRMIRDVIQRAHAHGCKVGLCGQAPSDKPDFALFLLEAGIDSFSVTPDSFLKVLSNLAKKQKKRAA